MQIQLRKLQFSLLFGSQLMSFFALLFVQHMSSGFFFLCDPPHSAAPCITSLSSPTATRFTRGW